MNRKDIDGHILFSGRIGSLPEAEATCDQVFNAFLNEQEIRLVICPKDADLKETQQIQAPISHPS